MSKLTSLDNNQIQRYSFNEELMANRVELVGSDNITVNIDTKPLEEAIKAGFEHSQSINFNESIKKEIEYREIKIPEIIKEVKIVEVPKYIITKEIEQIEVQKTIFVPEVKIIEIEKPIYITKTEYVDKIILQKEIINLNYILIIQTIAIIGLIVKLCIK